LTRQKRSVGQPRKWDSPEELIGLINHYLETTNEEEYTVTGLALALGSSRQGLMDYEKREEFAYIVQEAKLIVENSYELELRKHGRTGTIFALKNFGWKDKSEVESTNTTTLKLEDLSNDQLQAIVKGTSS